MKTYHLLPAALAVATATALFAGCSSMPKDTALLDQARADYAAAERNPQTVALAPLEFKQAGDALAAANQAAEQNENTDTIDHLAYIAKQRVAISQEAVKRKNAEIALQDAAKERDNIRLSERTQEANIAKQSAQTAQSAANDAQNRANRLEAKLNDLATKQTDRGTVVTLGDVLFNVGKAQLNPGGMRNIQKLASALQQDPKLKVTIEGFTDSTGSAALNQQLSERRAQAVQDALVAMGVDRNRISTRGYGEEYPVASNDTAASRQMNRRVEVILSNEKGSTSSGN